MEKPLISVIIPVYNTETYLDKCIRSVLAQDYGNLELILVDDGSTDRSGPMMDDLAEQDSRIVVIHKKNGGQSSARNVGLDRAKGEYISFVDSDDHVTPDYLTYLLSLFPEDDGCRISACNHLIVRGEHSTENTGEGDRVLSREEAFEEVLFHGCIDVAPWGKLYRREVFETLRFPEGRIFEDTWLFGSILNATDRISFGRIPCYNYIIRDLSTVRKEFSPKNLQYIEAAERLAEEALACSPALQTGAVRRINHARLSVLRYMEHSGEKELKRTLRREVLRDAPQFIRHPRTPKRDRIAVTLLRAGLHPYYLGWKIYTRIRG